jgi:hypothetical protein
MTTGTTLAEEDERAAEYLVTMSRWAKQYTEWSDGTAAEIRALAARLRARAAFVRGRLRAFESTTPDQQSYTWKLAIEELTGPDLSEAPPLAAEPRETETKEG